MIALCVSRSSHGDSAAAVGAALTIRSALRSSLLCVTSAALVCWSGSHNIKAVFNMQFIVHCKQRNRHTNLGFQGDWSTWDVAAACRVRPSLAPVGFGEVQTDAAHAPGKRLLKAW